MLSNILDIAVSDAVFAAVWRDEGAAAEFPWSPGGLLCIPVPQPGRGVWLLHGEPQVQKSPDIPPKVRGNVQSLSQNLPIFCYPPS